MKTFQRIFRYAPTRVRSVVQFLLFAVLGIVFGLLNFTLFIPLLDILFEKKGPLTIPVEPQFELSADYGLKMLEYFFSKVAVEHGGLASLLYVCGFIICSAFLANT